MKFTSKKWDKVRGKGISVPPSTVGKVVDCNKHVQSACECRKQTKQTKAEWVCVLSLSSLTTR